MITTDSTDPFDVFDKYQTIVETLPKNHLEYSYERAGKLHLRYVEIAGERLYIPSSRYFFEELDFIESNNLPFALEIKINKLEKKIRCWGSFNRFCTTNVSTWQQFVSTYLALGLSGLPEESAVLDTLEERFELWLSASEARNSLEHQISSMNTAGKHIQRI